MIVSFATNKLSKVLNSGKEIIRDYGPDNGKRIQMRLQSLRDSANLDELSKLPQIRPHELTGDRAGQISLDVKHPYRLLIEPDHKPLPTKPDGGLDWSQVTAVRVLEITDTH